MDESPNQFRVPEPSPKPLEQTTEQTTTKTVVHDKSLSRMATPLIIALGLLLVAGGIIFGLRQDKPIVSLPDYSPKYASPSPTPSPVASPATPTPSASPVASPSASPTVVIQPTPSHKSKRHTYKHPKRAKAKKSVAVAPIVKGVATSKPVASQPSPLPTFLPEYQPVVSLPDFQPQYVQPSPSPTAKQTVTVHLSVAGRSYTTEVQPGATVLQVFQSLTSQGLSYKTKSFSGLGELVTEINGQAENGSQYWKYSLNGIFATKGVSNQTVSEGDMIVWTLS